MPIFCHIGLQVKQAVEQIDTVTKIFPCILDTGLWFSQNLSFQMWKAERWPTTPTAPTFPFTAAEVDYPISSSNNYYKMISIEKLSEFWNKYVKIVLQKKFDAVPVQTPWPWPLLAQPGPRREAIHCAFISLVITLLNNRGIDHWLFVLIIY